jgi:hypothetical protein
MQKTGVQVAEEYISSMDDANPITIREYRVSFGQLSKIK